jgi:hypothetical protein
MKNSKIKQKNLNLSELAGYHNLNLDAARLRLEKARSYQDLSTVWICVTRGTLPTRVVGSWISLMRPMNQKVLGPLFIEGKEVGAGYQAAVEMILNHPELKNWKYLLTVEEDNCPPPDGLLKLYESIEKYDCVAGLYWTKGEAGQPMIYGDPMSMPKNFIPQIPRPDTIQHCNGLGMGFNLFRIAMFKKLPSPWFRTVQETGKCYTQDLWFFENAGREGYRFACDTRVKVGHYDVQSNMMW